jgi:iron complex transport system permease protein
VEFLGAVPRERLIQEQQKAQIHLYPFSKATAEELFCIAVAESQVASTLPINAVTSLIGAPIVITLILRKNFSKDF